MKQKNMNKMAIEKFYVGSVIATMIETNELLTVTATVIFEMLG